MLWWLAQNMLMAGVLAGAVALLCRLGRFRPSIRHALWLVVLVKLLTPPGVQWPWPVPDAGPTFWPPAVSPEEQPPSAAGVLPPGAVPETPLLAEELFSVHADVLSLVAENGSSDAPSPQRSPEIAALSWPTWITSLGRWLWLAGAVGMVALHTIRLMRFRRLLARAQPAPSWLMRQLQEQATKLCVRPPALRVVPELGTPLLWSLGRPQLLWPVSLLRGLPAHCRRSVLAHELAHLRRRDHWVGWLLLLAECLWWWQPLFWYVRRQLRQNAELACDAWVVAVLPEDRRAYAEALIEVSQLVATVAAPVPALGMSRGPRQTFERRLTMILRERVPCRVPLWGYLAIGLLTLIALPSWSLGQRADEPKKEAPPANYYYVPVTDPTSPSGARYEVVQTPPASTQPAAGTERDRKLQELEQKLETLLKEVKALRGAHAAAPSPYEPRLVPPPAMALSPLGAANSALTTANPLASVPLYHSLVLDLRAGDSTTMLLSRATYKLPRAKAEALAAFLREHVKTRVMETTVEGNSLIVTTTPEAQKAIGQLIALIQAGTPEKPPVKNAPAGTTAPAAEPVQFFFRLQEDVKRDPNNKLGTEEKSDQPRRH